MPCVAQTPSAVYMPVPLAPAPTLPGFGLYHVYPVNPVRIVFGKWLCALGVLCGSNAFSRLGLNSVADC